VGLAIGVSNEVGVRVGLAIGVGEGGGTGGAGVGVLVGGAGVGVKVRVGTVWRSGLCPGDAQRAGIMVRVAISIPAKIQRTFSFIFSS